MPSIDNHWHPFSIASAPESEYLEFCIEDCGEGSWTNKIVDSLQGVALDSIRIELLGPYGTSFSSDHDEFSHMVAIGTGTGIMPMLSLFRQHISSLLKLDTDKHIKESERKVAKINNIYLKTRESEKSLTSKLFGSYNADIDLECDDTKLQSAGINVPTNDVNEDVIASIKEKAMAQVNLYILQVALSLVPILGVVTLGLSLSWNTLSEHTIVVKGEEIPVEPLPGSREVLIVCTILMQLLVLIETIVIRSAARMSTFLDWIFITVGVFNTWYWLEKDLWCSFDHSQNLFYSLQIGYMTFRAWEIATNFGSSFFNSLSKYEQLSVPQKFHLIWSSRSALLVSKILPDICSHWDELENKWGTEAIDLCQVSIYVTDKNQHLVHRLKEEVKHTSIAKKNWIKFERPNFPDILEDESIERIEGSLLCSNTLVAFCGSKKLASTVHEAKVMCDMEAIVSGNYGHVCQFESESYGVRKEVSEKAKLICDKDEESLSDQKHMLKRKDMMMRSAAHLSFRSQFNIKIEEMGDTEKEDIFATHSTLNA